MPSQGRLEKTGMCRTVTLPLNSSVAASNGDFLIVSKMPLYTLLIGKSSLAKQVCNNEGPGFRF